MRVLTRMRPLVAIAALLLLTLAPIAQANVPGRPIDRPESPPEPVPVQIGDPEQPTGGLPTPVLIGGQTFWFRLPASIVRILNARAIATPIKFGSARNWRARNAR